MDEDTGLNPAARDKACREFDSHCFRHFQLTRSSVGRALGC